MSYVSVAGIMAKVNEYAKSPECKRRANEVAEGYIRKNRKVTDAGSPVLTIKEMERLAKELVIMVGGAANGRVADSVGANLSTLTPGGVSKTGTLEYEIELSFKGDLSRPSLEPGVYGSINNIIALMNNGYSKPNARYVGGYWNGVYVNGLTSRPALEFMQSAVNMFNAAYGHLGVHAELSAAYD